MRSKKKSENRFAKGFQWAFECVLVCQFACLIPRKCKSWPSPPQCRCQIPAASCHSKLCLACSGWTRGWRWVPPFPPRATPARRGWREKRARICVRNDPLCTRRTDSRLEWQTRRCWLQHKMDGSYRQECSRKCASRRCGARKKPYRISRQNDLFHVWELVRQTQTQNFGTCRDLAKSGLSHRVMNYCATGPQTSSARVQKSGSESVWMESYALDSKYCRTCLFSTWDHNILSRLEVS